MTMGRAVMAEPELTMVPSLRTCPEADMYVPVSERADSAARGRSRRQRFWCPVKGQDVEVEFETKTRLGFSRPVGVNRCSIFDQPEKPTCGRHCLDSDFRRLVPPALPMGIRQRALWD
jgi:hypothetical protein